MSHNQFFDVVPPGGKRSIRDIPLPNRKVAEEPVRMDEELENESIESEEQIIPPMINTQKNSGGAWKWVVGLVVLLGLGYGTSFAFHKATVTVVPRSTEITVDGSFVGKTSAAPDEIQYDVVTFTDSASRVVPTEGEKEVSRKASGSITIYNNFSANAQELIENTRFESAEGKIYRIDKAVVVPGQKTVDGKKVAGSVQATVYADMPGEAYNIAKATFTIPGFKGTPRYSAFSATTNSAIAGGFVGKEQSVSASVQQATETELRKELEASLEKGVFSRIPADFVLLSGASTVTYRALPSMAAESGKAKVAVEGTVTATIFKKTDLETAFSKVLASTTVGALPFKEFAVESFENITVAFSPENKTASSTIFAAKGTVRAIASLDKDKLREDIKGKSRGSILAIISSYPQIERAEISISPPWLLSIPTNPERIVIIDETGNTD